MRKEEEVEGRCRCQVESRRGGRSRGSSACRREAGERWSNMLKNIVLKNNSMSYQC